LLKEIVGLRLARGNRRKVRVDRQQRVNASHKPTVCYAGMMKPEQCRAARGLLGWDKATLAKSAPVSIVTLSNFEAGKTTPYRGTMLLLERCLEAAGVEFIAENENGGGPGVRLAKPQGGS
jgi:hypothetical protein